MTMTRREFLKAAGITSAAVGVAVVMPGNWFGLLDEPVGAQRVVPVKLLYAGKEVVRGVAEYAKEGQWVAVFVPGQAVGVVDGAELQGRVIPMGPIHMTEWDSLEITFNTDI